MLRTTTLLSAALCALSSTAQVRNALDLDGIDDQVVVNNASALIANAEAVSLGCWVYPRNLVTTFPDYDGFAGFRNEVDADFYLVQIPPGLTVEGRFRNSDGEAATVTLDDLEQNVWQYLMLVYDGSTLTLYRNGEVASSAAASGSITGTAEPLLIGNVVYSFNDFLLDGRIDEVSLWDRALSAAEVACAANGVLPDDHGLQLYYKCDQGTAGGNNLGQTTLLDATAHRNGALQGFALNGTSSNYVDGVPSTGSITATVCPGEGVEFNGTTYYTAGGHGVVVPTGEACDSIATLMVNVTSVNLNVAQSGALLIAGAPVGPYQWLDCANGYAPVPGATAQVFTPAATSTYAVQVTSNGCTDTSVCYMSGPVGIVELAGPIASVAPIPTTGRLVLELRAGTLADRVRVVDLGGREVLREAIQGRDMITLDVGRLASGSYLVEVWGAERQGFARFVKE